MMITYTKKSAPSTVSWLRLLMVAVVAVTTLTDIRVEGLNDTATRAIGLGQAYTALARGPEAVFWNPANLALRGFEGEKEPKKFTWEMLSLGGTLVAENNSFSVQTYNDNFTDPNHEIRGAVKSDLLGDIPSDGLKFNVDFHPVVAALVPINGGISFPLPGDIRAAVTTTAAWGIEGEMPKDMIELMLFGNEFDRQYDIAKWNGSQWAVGGFNFAGAKAWMPSVLKDHLREFTVGSTLKILGGIYTEIVRSDGGFISRPQGTNLDAYAVTQGGGGVGFGLDLGVAGTTRDGKTVVSIGMLNLLDTFNWSIKSRQDSVFAKASNLRVTKFLDPELPKIEEVLENDDIDGDGEVDFNTKLSDDSFSRSLPAMLRVGVAHQPIERLTVVGNFDQAFSDGFGVSSTPRISTGAEYRLVPWFPTRIGLSLGGRGGSSLGVGLALGPWDVSHVQFQLLDLAFITRGGLLPGVAKGTALSLMVFRLNFI